MRQRGNLSKSKKNYFAALAAWVGLLVLLIPACDRKPTNVRSLEPRRVVATIYPLADIARRIGGKQANVQWFIEGGHSLSEIPSDTAGWLQVADLVVARGVDDSWALVRANDPASAADYVRVDLLNASAGRTGYLWLDPRVVRELAAMIRQRLSEQQPEYEAYFRDNEQSFLRELDALVKQYGDRLASHPDRRRALFSTSDFLPLADAMGIELIEVPLESTEQRRAMDAEQIRKRASAENLTRLFIPADRTAAYQRDLSARTGLEIRTLDPLGSSAPAAGRSTYLDILRYNLESLVGP